MTPCEAARRQIEILQQLVAWSPEEEQSAHPDVQGLQQLVQLRDRLLAQWPEVEPDSDDPEVQRLRAEAQRLVRVVIERDRRVVAWLKEAQRQVQVALRRRQAEVAAEMGPALLQREA